MRPGIVGVMLRCLRGALLGSVVGHHVVLGELIAEQLLPSNSGGLRLALVDYNNDIFRILTAAVQSAG